MFDILYEKLDAVGETVLIVLDEIDHIGSDNEILYIRSSASTPTHRGRG